MNNDKNLPSKALDLSKCPIKFINFKNSSKDFNYIYSPNVDLGDGTIENAISGYNLRYQLGDRAAGIKDQYFYIPNQESGEWEFINNPKTGKPLINQDYKKRNY